MEFAAMCAQKYPMKTTLIILVGFLVTPVHFAVAQESAMRSWWNPFGIGTGDSGEASAEKYSDFSGRPVTPGPNTSMPKMEESKSSAWQWPKVPKPQWQAPSMSWPTLSWPSWMKSSEKTSSRSSNSSTMSNWNRSTRRWWKNTSKMLNPFASTPSGSKSSVESGFNGGYSSRGSADTSTSSWGLFNWWSVPEEKKLETPNDFFSLPKP